MLVSHPHMAVGWVLFPLIIRAFGIMSSLVGIMTVRSRKEENPMNSLNRGYFVALALCVVAMVAVSAVMFKPMASGWLWLMGAGIIGIVASVVVVFVTQYYTEARYSPTKRIAEASRTGPATVIVEGMSVGFETVLPTALIICVALGATY